MDRAICEKCKQYEKHNIGHDSLLKYYGSLIGRFRWFWDTYYCFFSQRGSEVNFRQCKNNRYFFYISNDVSADFDFWFCQTKKEDKNKNEEYALIFENDTPNVDFCQYFTEQTVSDQRP